MSMTRRSLLLVAIVGAVSFTAFTQPSSAGKAARIRIWNGKQQAVTEGEVVVTADPAAVYAAVVAYERWPQLFPEVARVKVKPGPRATAVMEAVSLQGTTHTLRFDNNAKTRTVRFTRSGDGADVWAELVFRPAPRAGATRVHARLHADVSGISSLFVSDEEIRHKREQTLTSYLESFSRYFATR